MTRRIARASRVLVAAVALVATSTSCVVFEYLSGARDGCTEWASIIAFDTSNEVLRGTWQGVASDYPTVGTDTDLTLNLTATFVDERTYTVAGTFVLGAEEPLAMEGTVWGRCGERYVEGASVTDLAPQALGGLDADVTPASIPPSLDFFAEVRDAADVLTFTAEAEWGNFASQPSLEGGEVTMVIRSQVEVVAGGGYHRELDFVRVAAP